VGSRRVVLLNFKNSCVQAMPLRSGFRSGVRCPLWMLDFRDMTIIPLAKRRQTNPIYPRRPGQGGEMLAENCSIEVIAKRFSIGHIGNMLFVAAEIDMPEFALQGWINMWQGTHTPPAQADERATSVDNKSCERPAGTGEAPDLISDEECPWTEVFAERDGPPPGLLQDLMDGPPLTGTLFCALRDNAQLCLCGSCMHSWVEQGWVCEQVWRHRFGLGIEY
jgi:hypothetical protein